MAIAKQVLRRWISFRNGSPFTSITAANYKRRRESTKDCELQIAKSEFWDLILDGAQDGVANMASDEALLNEVEEADEPRTIVRFYSWVRPTVSLGRNQKIEKAVDLAYCAANSIDIVHRPTGGRAVLHDDELTYAVVSNDSATFGDTIYGNYKRVSEALCIGYNRLGVPAVLAPDTRKAESLSNECDPPCFISPSRYELMVD